MTNDSSILEQFIYQKCYEPLWIAACEYVAGHPSALNLTYSRIKYPSTAALEDMVLQTTSNIRADGNYLFFDAIVECTLLLVQDDGYRTIEGEIKQCLNLSCKALIEDRLRSVVAEVVLPGKKNSAHGETGYLLSHNIIPVIHKENLDAAAEDFLKTYYPEALITPMPVPIREIAEQMGLDVLTQYHITKDFGIFGQICFFDETLKLFSLFDSEPQEVTVKRGTIIIDPSTFIERNIGCVNNTIAHELFHWHRHRLYATINNILNGQTAALSRCPVQMNYPGEGEEWTDQQRLEWQANRIAPRILMPLVPFREKVNELYAAYDYANSPFKAVVLECIANDLAAFYKVSKQSAIIRMVDAGYPEANHLSFFAESSEQSFSNIEPDHAFLAYTDSEELQRLINDGLFVHANGYFVINDEKYVSFRSLGGYVLTDYAWRNLSECALRFSHKQIRINKDKSYPATILHRDNTTGYEKVPSFDPDRNASIIERAETLKRKRAEFEQQKQLHRIAYPERTSWQLMYEIITQRGISKSHFCSMTGLEEYAYRRAEKNENTKPKFETIIAFACGLDLDLDTTNKILQLAGHAFNDTDEHLAYKFCITGFQGKAIEERNEFLQSYGYPPLGSKQLK